MKLRPTLIAAALAMAGSLSFGSAMAGTVIYNTGVAGTATVALGVNDDGSLNTADGNIALNSSRTGLAFKMTPASGGSGFYDSTSPGCFCEGWGVSAKVGSTSHSGYANVSSDSGPNNLTFAGPTNVSGSTVTTTTTLTDLTGLKVTQDYTVSAATSALFRDRVTITNTTGSTATDVRYVRVMDWDVPFTEFSEFVTIRGTASTTLLEKSHLDGFASANPLNTTCDASGCGYGGVDVDVTDAGPRDHGAYFRFNFGTLLNDESVTFDVFYGAADTEGGALSAIAAAGLELYSLGQSSGGEITGSPATFIFGFKGVGGTVLIPEPGSLALVGLALIGLGAARRGRRQA